jgi:anti-sigma factor RsiW
MSMKCSLAGRMLSSYLDRRLSVGGKAALEDHLKRCPSCRAELDQLAADRDVLKAVEPVAAPPGLRTRTMAEIRAHARVRASAGPAWARVLALAASVLVIAGSAWAGVALGGSMARFEQRGNQSVPSSDAPPSIEPLNPLNP